MVCVRLAELWLKLAKNIVLAEFLREENTVPAKKNKLNSAVFWINRTGPMAEKNKLNRSSCGS